MTDDDDDYQDEHFLWNRKKSAASARKRNGLAFEEACKVFDDGFALEHEDRKEPHAEQRFIRIGVAGGRIVMWTPRGDRARIFSAREARPAERRRYHEAIRQR